MVYTIVLAIHLICAIIFIGFLFTEVVFLSVLKNVYGEDKYEEIKANLISKRAIKVMPFVLLTLVLTGLYMLTYHLGNMSIFLMIKLFLVSLIVLGVIYSLSMRLIFKKPTPKYFRENFHTYALIIGFMIAISAKLIYL